jgi:hypothetical protein
VNAFEISPDDFLDALEWRCALIMAYDLLYKKG